MGKEIHYKINNQNALMYYLEQTAVYLKYMPWQCKLIYGIVWFAFGALYWEITRQLVKMFML